MPRLYHLLLPLRLYRRKARARHWWLAAMLAPLLTLLLLVGAFLYIIYKPPSFVIRQFQRWWPDVLWRVSTSSKIIALTIDDAPSEHTKDVLQVLEANNATATFFVIGSHVPGFESTLEDVIRAGHELGNHAMHDEPSRSLSDTTLIEQIQRVEELLSAAYASAKRPFPSKYFRPGSGFFSTKMRETLQRLGYRLVLGDIYPHDPQIPYWRMNARHVLSMAHAGGIIVCHDGREWTAPMLRRVLPELKRRGYRIVSVTELLEETRSSN
jgi:peptidoglycan/xylan/chitin deacetylase (PgdA/CDA1 family)